MLTQRLQGVADVPVDGSLYDRLGGSDVLAAAVDLFYRRVLDDPAVAPYFAGVDVQRLVAHQRAFLSGALGGPSTFTGRRLAEAHRHLSITDGSYDVVSEHLLAALRDLGADDLVLDGVSQRLEQLRAQVVAAAPT